MIRSSAQPPLVLSVLLGLALTACSPSSGPTASAPATPPAAPTASAATISAVPSASSLPTASASPSTSAGPVGSAAACPVETQAGLLPSDRLVDLAISSTVTHDLLTFVFAASTPSPAGPPRGTLEGVEPPFSFAGSGLSIELLGQHAVRLRFSGMTIASETGEATYHGPTDVTPNLPALREAIQFDASEGIVGWYVGYDGPGCVTLARQGNDVTLMIAHPEAPAG